MGSTSKTKHGKQYRAPVDQARKAERQRVIKKNKKERHQVRVAIAKHTEVAGNLRKMLMLERQILGLDERTFAVDVLRKKQKTILDVIEKRKAILISVKDDDETQKLNEAMKNYYAQVASLKRLAEQERIARSIDPTIIPLPDGEMKEGDDRTLQLMGPRTYEQPKKKEGRSVSFKLPRDRRKPPGPPCGPPPDLSASEDEMDNYGEFDDNNLDPVPIPEELGHVPGFGSLPQPTFNTHPLLRPPTLPMKPPLPLAIFAQPPQIPVQMPVIPDVAIISGAPQIRSRNTAASSSSIGPIQPTTLVGAPQLRDLRREAAKLVPTVLKKKPNTTTHLPPKLARAPRPAETNAAKSTDEAYNEFMKELSGLL
ncbi:unnamed protein product, partial [Mesorhabditis belari]|uniref:WW domain-binding protein 11 n=1 Tax=Mesorhabditis belari TaxID=2138241 RepID=A0AAF3EZD6_9BILA